MNKSKRKNKARWKTRSTYEDACNSAIDKYARNECENLGLDPDQWATYTLDWGPVMHLVRRIRVTRHFG